MFKDEMVRAVLNTRPGTWPPEPIDPSRPFKWVTRRLFRRQPQRDWVPVVGTDGAVKFGSSVVGGLALLARTDWQSCPYGPTGRELYVKEAYDVVNGRRLYRADNHVLAVAGIRGGWQWSNPLFMPRKAARIFVVVKDCRGEWLRDMTGGEAEAEGSGDGPFWRLAWGELWDGIHNSPKKANRNPYTAEPETCYVSYPWDDVRYKAALALASCGYPVPRLPKGMVSGDE